MRTHRSLRTHWSMMPRIGRPLWQRPMSVPKSGLPASKDCQDVALISESQRTHPHSLWCWILSLVVAGGSVVCGWCVHIVSAAQPISANAE